MKKNRSSAEIVYCISGDIKQASTAATAIEVAPAEKVLLGMTRHLRGRPSLHKVLRNASPITLSHFLQSEQEQPVFLLCPRNS